MKPAMDSAGVIAGATRCPPSIAGFLLPMKNAKTAAAARRGSKATKAVAYQVSPADLRKLGGVLIQTAGILEKMAGIISRAGGAK